MTDESLIRQLKEIAGQFKNLADDAERENEEEFETAEQASKANAKSGF